MATPTPPATSKHLVVSFPTPKVLLLRLNRPEALNAMVDEMEADLCRTLDWAEEEPGVWVIIVTGTGRLFCAGQDLKNWLASTGTSASPDAKLVSNIHGFGSLARRRTKKPLIIALNGHAYGGGAEIVSNGDIVIGVKGVKIAFPEVLVGVCAGVGGIPNSFARSPQLAPYLFTGAPIPTHILETHVLTEVVDKPEDVLTAALKWAKQITLASPESVWLTKEQINLHKAGRGINDVVVESFESPLSKALYRGDNIKEGLRSFTEKRKPVWRDPPRLTGQSKL